MKRVIKGAFLLAIVVLCTFAGIGTALAQTPPAAPAIATAQGTISAIDKPGSPPQVTIHTKDGTDVSIKVVANTRITKAGIGKATLNDLAVNDKVQAVYNKNTNDAARILDASPAKHHNYSGVVKSVDVEGKKFVVTIKGQVDVTLLVNANTKIRNAANKTITLADLKTGNRVVASAIESTDGNVAQLVRLIPVMLTGQIKSIDTTAKSFVLTTKNSGDVTILVDANTKIRTAGGTTATLNDLKVGNRVIVTATESNGGDLALLVRVMPVTLTGLVKSVDTTAKSFVLTTKNSGDVAITVDAKTKFAIQGVRNATLNDLKVGSRAVVVAMETSGGNLALTVRVMPVTLVGQIKSIDASGKSFVLTTKALGDVTINVDANTKYQVPGNKSATLNDLKVGNRVVVMAMESSSGDLALSVRVMPVTLVGQIKSIDTTAKTFVLTTKNQGDVTITVNANTKIVVTNDKDAEFEDLKVGNRVVVIAVESSTVNLALSVRLMPVTLVGQIKSIDAASKSFVLTTKTQGDVTVKVTTSTKLKAAGDKNAELEDLKAGDRVVVTGVQSSDGTVALLIRLLPAGPEKPKA